MGCDPNWSDMTLALTLTLKIKSLSQPLTANVNGPQDSCPSPVLSLCIDFVGIPITHPAADATSLYKKRPPVQSQLAHQWQKDWPLVVIILQLHPLLWDEKKTIRRWISKQQPPKCHVHLTTQNQHVKYGLPISETCPFDSGINGC